jgi:energy-coupling factor transporter ATP-binding protein EcfA2
MGRDDEYDVFLSYARRDGGSAAELNDWLRACGLHTFFDRSELRPGLRWIPALEDAIGRSNAVAILVGRHGIGNTQQYERELALVRQTQEDGFPVIPVMMPGCQNPPAGFLQLLTWIDLSRNDSVLRQTEGLEALRGAINRQAVTPSSLRKQICPYRGLEPFREEDAAFFCGRADAINDLVSQIQKYSFVAVVGPSGSGKSSLVFAGLLPALRQQRETTVWDVVSFRPGTSPLRALATAFGGVPENAGPAATDTYFENEAAAYRAGDPGKLNRIVNDRLDAAPEKPDRILIYVDQWEELYAMAPTTEDAEQRRQHSSDVDKFIASLVAAASGQKSRATVVLTVRADFYNPLIRHTQLSTLLPRQQVNIPPMRPSDLRSAIETPAKKAGLTFVPPELVDQILNDVGPEEGRLPLLQFALKETWEKAEGNQLTAEAYTEVGGVQGAIQKTAERAYAALTSVQQTAARRLFLRLVTPGQGREDTRARSEIPDDAQQRDIVNLFSNSRIRLLVTGYETLQGQVPSAGRDLRATVEIAHEALIRRWPTLREWVDANRENLRAREAVRRAKAEWEENGKIDKFLLDLGIQLERGRSLLDDPGDVPVDDLRDYVDRSIEKEKRRLDAEREAALADQKRIAEAERQAKEAAKDAARLSEAARSAAEVARRKLRNRLVAAVSAAVIAMVALLLLGFFNFLRFESLQESQRQLDRANLALAQGLLNDLDLKSDQPLTERQRNTLWKLATSPEAVHRHFISMLSASPEDMDRVEARFNGVSRSLGLQWPSPAEAEKLLHTAIAARNMSRHKRDLFRALAEKLTEAQARQTLAPLLNQLGKATNPNVLLALQALAEKLTEAQVQQAFDAVLDTLLQRPDDTSIPTWVEFLAKRFRRWRGS